jgi:cell division protein YceG involved in septum cleavage
MPAGRGVHGATTDSVESISGRLQDRGLITNARVFRYYVAHNGGLVLTPGDYELRPGTTSAT